MRPLALDLFAGAGGATIALERLGYRTVSFDNWAPAVATHQANGLECHQADIIAGEVNWAGFRGTVELLWGSPPCQPFSTATTNGGEWDHRDGFPAFLDALATIRPPVAAIENVPGMAAKRNAYYLDSVLSAIADLGYEVDWRLLDATDFGVPQRRQRVVIFAMLGEEPVWPDPTHHAPVTVGEAIGDGTGNPPGARVVYMTNPIASSSYKGSLLYNGRGRPLDLDAPSLTINASGGNHVHWFDTANTHRAYWEHLRSGGAPYVGDVPGTRRLTPEQMAVLQGFPADFMFTGPPSVQVKQIGNAAPPALVENVVGVNAPAVVATYPWERASA